MTEPDFLSDTRASYDAVAATYAERFHDELAGKPLERAMLAAFAELVKAAGDRPVADVGCGPGRGTAYLYSLGLPVFGIDLSPRMVERARRTHPGLRFEEGSMTALDLPDGALGGIVAMYSVIHVPTERLPEVFAEFHRVLAPGGLVLLVFQVGDTIVRRSEAFGHPVSLDYHRRRPEQVAESLGRAGFVIRARTLREPDDDGVETTPRALLLAARPASGGAG